MEALLSLYRETITEYEIPGSSFGPLAAYPQKLLKDSDKVDEPLKLRLASLHLGNFEAFRLLDRDTEPNDGTLHVAALLALPNFVRRLLETHSPDHKLEDMGHMIPLACVCVSKPRPWCKFADDNMLWRDRQRYTMYLLGQVTRPGWRFKEMTVLHWAMADSYEAAKAIIDALDIPNDPERHHKYLYKDKVGKVHTPEGYIRELWQGGNADEEEMKDLISRLQPEPVVPGAFPITERGVPQWLRSVSGYFPVTERVVPKPRWLVEAESK